MWSHAEILNESGEAVIAHTVIISASRATYIPTFYSDWFVARWKAGYVKWKNPFNGVASYVSFQKTKAVVFWTKNPRPIFKHIDFLNEEVKNYYFQFTLNDYDHEEYEVKVPRLQTRIETFKELSKRIGKEKVVWRFDPLLLTKDLSVKELLSRVAFIGNELHEFTSKFVFSFADISIYSKVQSNLKNENIDYKEFSLDTMIEFAEGLQKLNTKWKLELATCAEKFDLEKYGVSHNKCIDDDLMIKLFSHDKMLMQFLGVEFIEPGLFGEGKVEKEKISKTKGREKHVDV